jgi:transcriptional regulator with XRE-family HTH domain
MNHLELKKFRKDNNITQQQLADIAGVSVRAVQSWEQNQRNITQSAIMLIRAFEKENTSKDIPNNVQFDNLKSVPSKNLIPLYDDVTTIGGVNERIANTDGVSSPSEYIDTGDWFREATAAIRHYGDSMIEYPPGCILALKEVGERQLIIWGKDYVIETNEYRITKRVQRGKDEEHIRAYSSNTETYPDGQLVHEYIDVAWKDIRRIFLVLGYVVKKNGGTIVYSNQSR